MMLLVGPAHATAVACEQNKARYIDPESDLVFAFEAQSEQSAFLQAFSIGSDARFNVWHFYVKSYRSSKAALSCQQYLCS